MLTSKQLQRISEQTYWVERNRKDVEYSPKEGFEYFYDYKNKNLGQFQVLKVEDNVANGMQAMAVAPVVDGKADISQIVIAYAGTNIGDGGKDVPTDVQMIGFGNTDTLAVEKYEDTYVIVDSQVKKLINTYKKY